jgi:hypothetical protein
MEGMKEERALLTKAIIKATNEMAKLFPKKDAKDIGKEKKISPKAAKLAEFFSEGDVFGCNTDKAAKLVEILIGEPLSITRRSGLDWEKRDFEPKRLQAFVPLLPGSVTNKHDYKVGKVAVIVGERRALDARGSTGNYISLRFEAIRPATEAEIKSFIDSVDDDVLHTYFDFFLEIAGLL